MVIGPQFRPNSSCHGDQPFDANITINVRSQGEVFVRSFGFEFVDPIGRHASPFILPGAVIDPTSSVLPPIPLPTSSPIPFPGQVTLSSVQVPPSAVRSFPFRLQFDCGVSAPGTLFVSVETTNARGAVDVARIRAQVHR
jgi:hypothetical protein